MSEDIKMADVFDLPLSQDGSEILDCTGFSIGHGFHTSTEDSAAAHAINNHDNLVKQVKDLEFSLDDRDCYIADADMKNEALTKQVAELSAALQSVKLHQEKITPSGFEFSSVWQMANKALEENQ